MSLGRLACLVLVVPCVLAAVVVLLNRAVYEINSRNGRYCSTTLSVDAGTNEKIGEAGSLFHTRDFCWSSGLVLVKGTRYVIVVTIPDDEPDWFDYDIQTDVEGYTSTVSYIHVIASPFKRWWRASWFKPIARIGTRGADEYVLNPIIPLPPLAAGTPHGEVVEVIQPDHFKPIDLASAARSKKRLGRRQLTSEITARTTGELFLYVNDAALVIRPGWPAAGNYPNNFGTALVHVEHAP